MTDTSGPTCGRQFAYYDHDSRSWRMWPATGLWGSIEFSETWPRTGCMSGGQAFELPTLVPPIIGSDCSSSRHLPTPKASDFQDKTSPADARRKSPALTAVSVHFPTPTASDATGGGATPEQESRAHAPTDRHSAGIAWGPYTEAVQRWERLTRPAPAPTEPNTKGNPRLNAEFASWMMGLPEGHVTQVPGISRANQLKAIGNGVCVPQAIAALRMLLDQTALLEMEGI